MTCSEARRLLPLFVGGDASGGEAGTLSRHLAGCPSCAREEAALRETLERVRQACPAVDAALREEVRRHVFERISRPRGGLLPRLAASPGWAATVLLIAGASLVWFALFPGGGIREAPVTSKSPPVIPPSTSAEAAASPSAEGPQPVAAAGAREKSSAPPARPAGRVARASAGTAPEKPVAVAEAFPRGPAGDAGTVRIEYQTSDPTVRITWFVNQPAHAAP